MGAVVTYGSHFLTHADWGCFDGEHKVWITVEARDENEARVMLPPVLRNTARVVKLNKFSPEQIRELQRTIQQQSASPDPPGSG